MNIHVFAISFPSCNMQGTYKFDSIQFTDVERILSSGVWTNRESGDSFPIHSNPSEPPINVYWRHTWPGVRHMLGRHGFRIKGEIERRGHGAGRPERMEIGDIGIVFVSNGADLKAKDLEPEDFEFIYVERTK